MAQDVRFNHSSKKLWCTSYQAEFGSNSRFAQKNLIFKILKFPFQKEILRFRNMPPDFETD